MDIDGSVVDRILDHVKELARRRIASACSLGPGVATGEAITRSKDELPSTNGTDGVNRGLYMFY